MESVSRGQALRAHSCFPWFYSDAVHWEEAPIFEAENTEIST